MSSHEPTEGPGLYRLYKDGGYRDVSFEEIEGLEADGWEDAPVPSNKVTATRATLAPASEHPVVLNVAPGAPAHESTDDGLGSAIVHPPIVSADTPKPRRGRPPNLKTA